jgi:hypothetical protein
MLAAPTWSSPRRRARGLAALACLGTLWLARSAAAQPSDAGFDKDAEDTIAAKEYLEKAPAEEAEADRKRKEKAKPPEDPAKYDPHEDPGKAYRFVGMRFRDVILPQFMVNVFAEGGSTVNVFMFGPEFSTRKDSLEFDFALSFADYSMEKSLFRGHGENELSYEEVSSTMKGLYFTLDVLYDIPIEKKHEISLLVGGGVGLGFLAGNLYRQQVRRKDESVPIDPENPETWQVCDPVSRQPPSFCDDKNDHYGDYSEPSWANGGARPFILPWISIPQVSLRYKPIKQLQTRFDTGFSLSGFFFGLSAGYGL